MDQGQDLVLTAKYLPDSEVSHIQDIAFSKNCDIVRYNVHIYLYYIDYSLIPEDADDKIVFWSSSDESLATVDGEGVVTYHGPGTVVLTAHLKSGVSRDFTLYITEDDVPIPESIYPDTEEIHMTVGSQSPCSISTNPSPAKIMEYLYESEDESVVTVGENGVLTAVGPGTARVRITTTSYDRGEDIIRETYATVIVTKEVPPVDPDDPAGPDRPSGPDGEKGDVPYTGDSEILFWFLLMAAGIAAGALALTRAGKR